MQTGLTTFRRGDDQDMQTAMDVENERNAITVDRRRVQRFRLDLPLRVEVSEGRSNRTLHYKVYDISAAGAFVKTKASLAAGTVVIAEIDLPYSHLLGGNLSVSRNDCMIVTTAWVSQVRSDGMVIRFKGDYRVVEISGSAGRATIQ